MSYDDLAKSYAEMIAASESKVRRMRDVQIWRRGGQGEWRFIRGIHFREPAP